MNLEIFKKNKITMKRIGSGLEMLKCDKKNHSIFEKIKLIYVLLIVS